MKKKVVIPILIVLALVIAGMAIYVSRQVEEETPQAAGMAVFAQHAQSAVIRDGEVYPLKKHLETLLLVGTDGSGETPELPHGIKPFYNQVQSDVIMLIAIDNDEKCYTAIQINRDTMMDDPWTDVIGNYGGTKFEQIALSHNSGSGGLDSLQNTVLAVKNLLFSLPVDCSIAFNMTGINTLNDLVGGVTVTLEDDLSSIDPELKPGATVTLRGDQAESFLRARMGLKDDTNISRMRRHRQYIDGFIVRAREKINSDSDFIMKSIQKVTRYMVTDMTAEGISDMVTKLDKYTFNGIVTARGELKVGQFYEFYVDEDDLFRIVYDACCEK